MAKVQVLAADVIARIAAGEVVERPASAVKELMENSLDAGATRVEVILTAGGKARIEIRDDGNGIARDDMDALFARHATSKIHTNDDLDHILSFGFRGEALYSIGSVAEITLKSRARGSADGWSLRVKGGVKAMPEPAALSSQGTQLVVEEIFFNTPARKKFLKSDASEFDQCAGVFVPYALLHHDRHFILSHNGRAVYDLPPAASPAARAARVLALKEEQLLTLTNAGDGTIRFRAVLGDINIQRPRRDAQFVFVNGRPVQSKGLAFHMNDVYRLIMPDGVHPFFALFVDMPPEDVDVNIHPAKREVRLKDEARAGALLRRAVENILMTKGGAKSASGADIFTFAPSTQEGLASGRAPLSAALTDLPSAGIPAGKMVFAPGQASAVAPLFRHDITTVPAPVGPEAQAVMPFAVEPVADRLARARFLGTFIQKYHIFEEGRSLFLVDQHAAQERVMFETFAAQMAAGKVEVARLLVPVTVRLSPRELAWWEDKKQSLSDMGFESNQIGADAVALQTHPRVITNPERAFCALLEEDPAGVASRDALARRACRASVMSGDRMAPVQAEGQLRLLLTCRDPFTCPHGRPVFIELKESFLDKQFLRT